MPQNNFLELKTHYLAMPYDRPRRIRVLLPKNYYQERHKTYPVLYMHDGQNVFYSREAFMGHSWKVIPTLKKHREFPPLIIVGLDNSPRYRSDEYTPWPTEFYQDGKQQRFGGGGQAYAAWIVEVVKPFIDTHYRTRPARSDTLLAGSSLGGYITAYMGSAYPDIFGNLGVFSSAAWLSDQFSPFVAENPLKKTTKVYIQAGANESDAGDDEIISPNFQAQAYIDEAIAYYQTLLLNGHPLPQIKLKIFAGESHNEYFWAKHFPEFLDFCLKK
ncbi:alpha/beta hydrolase [Ligilactobacillus faecis]|uniref:Alpha/beta hydrolase-fold protein n=1 Tax=Ligilactobacillus faecis TaxID=762833 RepID=A0ABV4DRX0_9LACO|nr:alpha/beta hydrolase-fold protein [Ligilactobacillus faecis]WGN89324.1 alpha/beta hydrolase-fold protein [Ligilactobacillus faecis]